MKTQFSDHEFREFIYPAFPDAPRPPRKFTIDELVCTFLALHDVEVVPVGADIHMSRGEAALMGAAFGLTSPVAWDTMATGAQMKQDARIAARQEWNSWKQWALSHADWPSFKEKANSDYEKAAEPAEAWKSDPANQERFKELVQQALVRKRQAVARSRHLYLFAITFPVVLTLFTILITLLNRGGYQGIDSSPSQFLQEEK
jgi:hypothetical protein